MKTVAYIFIIGILFTLPMVAQQTSKAGSVRPQADLDKYLTHLPADLKLKEAGPHSYEFVCDYFTLSADGNLLQKERIDGIYTRALPGGKVRWTDVKTASAHGLDTPFPEGTRQEYMEGFTYSTIEPKKLFEDGFFTSFPPMAVHAKNLVWDTYMFEVFAAVDFAKLSLNTPYHFGPDQDIPMANLGNFNNHNAEITWTGISKYNGVPCALIRYEAFFNSLTLSLPGFDAKGRSHYWGEIMVSLQTKQVERGTIFEDVLLNATIGGQANKNVINVFRKGVLSKRSN